MITALTLKQTDNKKKTDDYKNRTETVALRYSTFNQAALKKHKEQNR